MPRALNSTTVAALEDGRIKTRGMIRFDLGSGSYGFWTGVGPFAYAGLTYVGAGSLIEVEGLEQSSGLQSVSITARLTSVPNSDLTPDILATIENEVYHQKPVTIYTAYFDPDTSALMSVEIEYRGYIDQIVHKWTAAGEAVIEGHFESKFRDLSRSGYRVRSDADQKRLLSNDNSLRHVSTVASERILFGRTQQQAPSVAAPVKKNKGLFGLFG